MRNPPPQSPCLTAILVLLLLRSMPLRPAAQRPRHIAAGAATPGPLDTSRTAAGSADFPLSFEINAGQFDEPVRFVARQGSGTFFFTPQEMAAVLSRQGGDGRYEQLALKIRFAGASTEPAPQGLDPLPTKSNYFLGNDPSLWKTGVPTYGRIAYHNLYPRTDLIYYGAGGQIKYDLVLRPGSDLSRVAFAYSGARTLRVNAAGQLDIETAWGVLVEEAPVAYTLDAQGAGRRSVDVRFVLRRDATVGFSAAVYDYSRNLVIDPQLVYSTFVGGDNDDEAYAMTLDEAGNAVVTGRTFSSDFPTTAGAFDAGHNGSVDVFVLKLTADGSSLLYSTFVGGGDADEGYAVALDGEGAAAVTGYTTSFDFPTTTGAYDSGYNGYHDVFVFKLAADGGSLLYSTFVGGNGTEYGCALALDEEANSTVTGYTGSSDFPTTPGAYDPLYNGNEDVFVLKLAADLGSLLYGTFVGGSNAEKAAALALDEAGNAALTGWTRSSDFPTTAGAYDTGYNGYEDVFVLKLAADGGSTLYGTFLGGHNDDEGHAMTLDGAGNATLTGWTRSSDFPTTAGAYDRGHNGLYDSFVLRLAADGGSLLYSTFIGGDAGDQGNAVALDRAGVAAVTGYTTSFDFPTTPDAYDPGYNGSGDAFFLRLAADGGTLLYGTLVGGSSIDHGYALALDASGNAVVAGQTRSSDFPTTAGAYDAGHNGVEDVFVLRLVLLLSAPSLLPIDNPDGDGDYVVDWDDVAGATSYTLEEDDNSGFSSPSTRYTGATSQYLVTGQGAGKWYYRVRASNDGGDSPWSSIESVSVGPAGPVLAPISNPDGDGDYLVDWNDVLGAISYTLEEDDAPSFLAPIVRYTGAASQYLVAGQGTGKWYYRVRGTNEAGDGPWGNVESVGVKPDAPVLLPISNSDGDGSYLVNWTSVPGADAYTLEEDDHASFGSPTIRYTGADSQYQVDDQIAGTWFYRARASNAGGDSPWSNTQLVSVIPGAPVLLPINNPDGDGDYPIDWEDAIGALGYTLEEDDNVAFLSPEVRYTGLASEYQVADQPLGSWYYRVRASNAGGNSAWSNVESVVVIESPGTHRVHLPVVLRSVMGNGRIPKRAR